jgi:hypothetical protein
MSSLPVRTGRFALAGIVAAIPSIVLMELTDRLAGRGNGPRLLFDLVPPLSVAVALWWIARQEGVMRKARGGMNLLAIAIAAVASWNLARQIYVDVHGSAALYFAGAAGALLLALPLPWMWSASRHAGFMLLAAIAAGILGVVLANLLRAPIHTPWLNHDRWLYLLMPVWQGTVFAALAFTRQVLRG